MTLWDVSYRLLGLVVQARYQLGLVLAVLNTVFVLWELRIFLDRPSPATFVVLVDSPLILALAAYLLAHLPPGIVFRRATTAERPCAETAEPLKLPRGCRASGRFRVGDGWEWRLLVSCTLALDAAGGVELRVPGAVTRWRPRRAAARRSGLGEWQWTRGGRMPLWTADPALIQRLVRERNPREAAPLDPATLRIPRLALDEVAAGWQYVGLRRWPALRLAFHDDAQGNQLTYLAFDSPRVRDAVAARLGGPACGR